jgi:glycosyltransferase involved in cell wall biosynthesis
MIGPVEGGANEAAGALKITIFSEFWPRRGGIPRSTDVLAEALTRQGHDVAILTSSGLGPHEERVWPYEVVRAPSKHRMIEVVRQSDVVHCQGVSTLFVLAALAGGHRPILTHHLHSAICPAGSAWSPTGDCTAGPRSAGPCLACPRHSAGGRLDMARWRTSVHLARSNVCPSHYLESRLGLPRSTTIYNPVHPQTFVHEAPLGPGEHGLIAFAGRPDPVKGLDVLFRALALLPDARLKVMGADTERPELEEQARSSGVFNRVELVGTNNIDRVVELYATVAVACVPSLWQEPFGYAAAESMASGRAVVATPSGALPELLAEGRGFLAAGFTPADLALALRAALEDPTGKAEAEKRARNFAKAYFHPGVVADQYLEAYRGP